MNGRYWLVRYRGDRWVPGAQMKFVAWYLVWAQGWALHGKYLSFVRSYFADDSSWMPGAELAAVGQGGSLVVEQGAGCWCMNVDSES